jgi:hypothetical protein
MLWRLYWTHAAKARYLTPFAFLWLPEMDKELAVSLMGKAIKTGEKWSCQESGKKKVIGDKDLVDFAHFLDGWERVVYNFCCKAIHLPDLHSTIQTTQ